MSPASLFHGVSGSPYQTKQLLGKRVVLQMKQNSFPLFDVTELSDVEVTRASRALMVNNGGGLADYSIAAALNARAEL